jgi:hypothetical protein
MDKPKDPVTLILFLIRPYQNGEEPEEAYYSVPKEDEDHFWDLYTRFKHALQKLGATTRDRSWTSMRGCNWEAKAEGEPLFITSEVVDKLEGQIKDRDALRESALAKLTPSEKESLGLYDMKVIHHWGGD